MTLVPCGTDTAARLAAAGDPTAATDAASCPAAIKQCRSNIPKTYSGASVRLQKQANGTWTLNGMVCSAPPRPQVTAAMVRDRVVRLIPGATLGLAPHTATLINIQTIMWVDAPNNRTLRPITILGQRVLIHLKIDHVAWDFGDGAATTSDGPGKPYDKTGDPCTRAQCPDYFGHTYQEPGRDTVTATASWTASFTVNGANPVTIPGTVAGPTAATALTVKQARAVLVPSPGQH